MDSEKVKVTVHSTILKLGQQPDPTRPHLKNRMSNINVTIEASSKHTKVFGFDLSYAQDRALFAVQVLLDETNYQGNAPVVKLNKSARYRYDSTLPVLEIKTADFLRAYGVKQTKTHRGMEFSPQGRRVAISALKDLAMDEYLVVYEKSFVVNPKSKKKMWRKTLVEDVAPLIAVNILANGRTLKIIPNPVLVDQIESYFILKPRGFFDLVPGKDIVAARFLDYLLWQGEMKRRSKDLNWEIRISVDVLAWYLRLNAMLNARKTGAIREKLIQLYKLGVNLGYLASYLVDQQGTKGRIVDVLQLKHLVPDGANSTSKESKI